MITPATAAIINTPTRARDRPPDEEEEPLVLCNMVESLSGSAGFCGSAGAGFFPGSAFAGRLCITPSFVNLGMLVASGAFSRVCVRRGSMPVSYTHLTLPTKA